MTRLIDDPGFKVQRTQHGYYIATVTLVTAPGLHTCTGWFDTALDALDYFFNH
jgi:hypothetical protein